MPNALTMAAAFEQAQRAARGHGMPGIRLGMEYGNQARALMALAAEDEREHQQREETDR